MSDDIKSLVLKGNKEIEAVRDAIENKADAEVVERIKSDLAETLKAKTALEKKNEDLENRISSLEAEKSRPDFSGDTKESGEMLEVKSAFNNYLRDPSDQNVKEYALALKSINITNDTNGGIAVEPVIGKKVMDELTVISPMRQLATVIQVSNENYVNLMGGAAGAGWAGELDERTPTAEPTFTQNSVSFGEVYSLVEITNHALHDISFDIEGYVINKILEGFRVKEGEAFISGNGVNKPRGILHPSANIPVVNTGNATTLGDNPADNLIAAFYSLKYPYRTNASFVMNARTLAGLVSLKDADGRYMLTSLTAGSPATLLGRPVVEEEGMADVAAGATSIVVGDIKAGYLIADITGTFNIIKEQVTHKGFTVYYVSKRVGGGVVMPEALRAIRVGV